MCVRSTFEIMDRYKNSSTFASQRHARVSCPFLQNAYAWNSSVALFRDRTCVQSEHAPTMSYEEMCNDVDNFAQKLGVKSAHLIGHSMGGKVAMTLALRYPEKVASLCVVDIAPVEYSATSMHVSIMDAMSRLDLETVTDMQKARHELKPAIPVRISFRKSHLSSGFHACCSELEARDPPSERLFQEEIVVRVMTKQTKR